jgi:uncharacterized membrane protein
MNRFKNMQYLIYTSAAFTIALLTFRVLYFDSYAYLFLVWNLFLAWVPYALSQVVAGGYLAARWQQLALALAWLAFFPNSAYIITDLFHLSQRPGVPLYLDLVLLFAAVWTGLLMGMVSLMNMEIYLVQRWGKRRAALLVLCCIALCAFGIYLGRYLRLNSWEIVSDPLSVVQLVGERILQPHLHLRTWAVTGLFTGLLSLLYYTLSRWQGIPVAAALAGGNRKLQFNEDQQ